MAAIRVALGIPFIYQAVMPEYQEGKSLGLLERLPERIGQFESVIDRGLGQGLIVICLHA